MCDVLLEYCTLYVVSRDVGDRILSGQEENMSGYKNGGGGWGTVPHFICLYILSQCTVKTFWKEIELEGTHVYLTRFVLAWVIFAAKSQITIIAVINITHRAVPQ